MDISDRIESRDRLAIAGHLVFAFEEWIAELIRQACDGDSPGTRDAVIKAVHFHDAFATGSLSPAQLAELAEGAAGWMEPKWPSDPAEADEVERLLGVSRELLELRDRALAAAANDNNNRGVLTIEPGLRGLLRSQTLVVLEFSHVRFDEARDLGPSELRAAASIFRNAIAVLDAIGWLDGKQDAIHAQVAVTAAHREQLERVRVDVAMSVIDCLKVRDDTADPEEVARIDQRVREARLTVEGLWQILHAPKPAASA
jgi:hypothetical protein